MLNTANPQRRPSGRTSSTPFRGDATPAAFTSKSSPNKRKRQEESSNNNGSEAVNMRFWMDSINIQWDKALLTEKTDPIVAQPLEAELQEKLQVLSST